MLPLRYYRKIRDNLVKQLPYTPSISQIIWCCLDCLKYKIKYKASMDVDYFSTQMYRKSEFTRKESLASHVRFPWRDALQAKDKWMIFDEKLEFYKFFDGFLNRKWMVLDGDTTRKKYDQFIEACGYDLFAKVSCSYGGKDVFHKVLDSKEKQEKLWESRHKTPLILEERVTQCEEIASFSRSSVNTVRIITLVDMNGDVKIASALLRMGIGDSSVDNYSSGGIVAAIDIQTGILVSLGKNHDGDEFVHHPTTGKQIVGYKIQGWEQYKEFAIRLAEQCMDMRYVGWDIVRTNQGDFCVIEGNKNAGVDYIECRLLYGIRPYYDALLNCDRNFRYGKIH